MLSNTDINFYRSTGDIYISPIIAENIQPASVDLTLHDKGKIFVTKPTHIIDFNIDDVQALIDASTQEVNIKDTLLPPGGFILARTVETLGVSNRFCARIDGKSKLGRLGITIHQTAGFVDPGFRGIIVLEIRNESPFSYYLKPGMKICQVEFMLLLTPSEGVYGDEQFNNHYQNQDEVVGFKGVIT